MSPHRQATEKQLAALVKARAALAKKHTCEHCGAYDPSHGLQKELQNMHQGTGYAPSVHHQLYPWWQEVLDTTKDEPI